VPVIAMLAGVVALAFGGPAAAKGKPTACPAGRFMLSNASLVVGAGAPANDVVEISGSQISTGSGCPPVHVSLKPKKKFTAVSARWKSCSGLTGPASLKAKIAAPACDTLSGKFIAKKVKPKTKKFTAKRVPIFSAPSVLTVGTQGGTFTNPTDGTSVTVPAGAYTGGQTAHVGVVMVGKADVFALEQALGLVPPQGFVLLEALQVIIPPSDPDPTFALTASIPDDGMSHPGLLIHTLIEPTSVAGEVDMRPAHLVFDGEVTQANGLFTMQISPQNIDGSPGRSCVANIPPTVPTCFIDGVVRDINGSPVADAVVTVSNLSLVARTNALTTSGRSRIVFSVASTVVA